MLIAMLWRLSLRVMRGSPSHPEQEPGWAGSLAHLTHWIFYGLLVLLPVMGLLAWFGTLGEAAELHEIGTTILIGVMVVLLVSVSVLISAGSYWLGSQCSLVLGAPGWCLSAH